jgi:hypothetical protein
MSGSKKVDVKAAKAAIAEVCATCWCYIDMSPKCMMMKHMMQAC